MSSNVTFIRCRLKTLSTFLVKFPPGRGMQIPLNSHEHGETLKAFYSMPSLRLNSWSESRSATIFSSVVGLYQLYHQNQKTNLRNIINLLRIVDINKPVSIQARIICIEYQQISNAAVMDSEGTLGRGHANGGRGLRRQRSLEWRERRGYGASAQSSSDDEDNARHAVGPVSSSSVARGARSPGQVFASILAQQYGNAGDRSYRTGSDTEGAATTDNPTTPFPTPPPTLTPNHRQASPFPLESTNSRRHHYNGSISSERSRNGNGETVYAASTKKTTSGGGTLGRRTRRGHASALSSSSTASDRSETVFPDEHTRMHLTNGEEEYTGVSFSRIYVIARLLFHTHDHRIISHHIACHTGRDSPPEPAPPEVPPRGPSLHATHTLRAQQNRNGCPPNASGSFTVPSDQMPTETYSGK
ncbi:Uncharacterized protein DBV15_07381 [Temnothorax longispinosus]|uniref:Uncharacterized protein n=1 Tax=Temnothorax longispinosus TaxID=300112 RepID=A0A4S2KYF3_9HYME|nr:Uncharacterized protein DBV15_07381 [Temnothorax longispinosus]